MRLRLSRDLCAGLYDALRKADPWRGLKLPPSHKVIFKIINDPKVFADFEVKRGIPIIRVSRARNGQLTTLLATIGHEMKHLHQWQTGDREAHGARFQAFAKRAASAIGVDPLTF